MIRRIFMAGLCCLVLGWAGIALAQKEPSPIAIDLSRDHVDITMGFAGAEFVVYGVTRGAEDVAIVVRGPERQMVVRRKDAVGGIWTNRESMAFDNVPVYYDVAMNRPARDMAATILRDYGIGLDALEFVTRDRAAETDIHRFREALVRNRQVNGYFPLEPQRIVFVTDRFFRAKFTVPADVPPGSYRVLAYFIGDGVVVDTKMHELRVAQTGFSARIYSFAYNHSLAYGVFAVLLAMVAGWGAWAVLRRE